MARAEGALHRFDQRLADAALPRRWPTALEAADIVVMNDDLRRIAETVRLSRRAHGVLWQNIVLALGIKAVFDDMGASLLVVFNGLRLLRGR